MPKLLPASIRDTFNTILTNSDDSLDKELQNNSGEIIYASNTRLEVSARIGESSNAALRFYTDSTTVDLSVAFSEVVEIYGDASSALVITKYGLSATDVVYGFEYTPTSIENKSYKVRFKYTLNSVDYFYDLTVSVASRAGASGPISISLGGVTELTFGYQALQTGAPEIDRYNSDGEGGYELNPEGEYMYDPEAEEYVPYEEPEAYEDVWEATLDVIFTGIVPDLGDLYVHITSDMQPQAFNLIGLSSFDENTGIVTLSINFEPLLDTEYAEALYVFYKGAMVDVGVSLIGLAEGSESYTPPVVPDILAPSGPTGVFVPFKNYSNYKYQVTGYTLKNDGLGEFEVVYPDRLHNKVFMPLEVMSIALTYTPKKATLSIPKFTVTGTYLD